MRKRFLGLFAILLILFAFSVSAESVEVVAFQGSFGINFNATDYIRRTNPITWVNDGEAGTDSGKYERRHTVAHGGIFKMEDIDASKPITYTVTFESANGFNFVSTSDSIYQRPFEFQVVQNFTYSDGTAAFTTLLEPSIGDTHSQETITWSNYTTNQNCHEMKFDLLLVMEGSIDRNTNILTLNNQEYPLIEGDYSAVVTISIIGSYYKRGSDSPTTFNRSVTIPFSAYYSDDTAAYQDNTVGISIVPTAYAANLDIGTMGMQQIDLASIDVLKYMSNATSLPEQGGADLRIFLSSSSNPFMQGEPFALVHTSVPAGGTRTSANHVKYRLYAVNDENINDYAIFRGDAFVDYIMNSKDKTEYITTTEHRPDLSGTQVHYHTYSGEIYIEMDEPITAMLPGMYRSNIYVHVVASDKVQ